MKTFSVTHISISTALFIDFFFLFEFSGINKALDARAIGVKVFEDYATTWYWILM